MDKIPATAGLEDGDRKDSRVEQISASAHAFTALTKEFAILFSSIEVVHFCDEDRTACSEANVGLILQDELCQFFNNYHQFLCLYCLWSMGSQTHLGRRRGDHHLLPRNITAAQSMACVERTVVRMSLGNSFACLSSFLADLISYSSYQP